jgi:hypothetical protein
MICILLGIAWLLISSGLLLVVWNSVVASLATVKKAKYWHALVVVLTLVVLLCPLLCGEGPCGGRERGDDKACFEEGRPGGDGSGNCGGMMKGKGMKGCDMPCGKMAKPDSTR